MGMKRQRAPLNEIPPEGFPGELMPTADRYWKYVDKSGGEDACWGWNGSMRRDNYGSIWVRDGMEPAHRVAWMLTFGRIPDHLVPDHLCKNHWCQNPRHMQLVTQAHNCTTFADLKSPFARNKVAKTCYKGHPFTPENTAVIIHKPAGHRGYETRVCLTCRPSMWRFCMVERAPRPNSPRGLKWVGPKRHAA